MFTAQPGRNESLNGKQIAGIVLECVDSIPQRVGRTKIALLLKGSESQQIRNMDIGRIRHFGALGHLTIAQIQGIVEQLLNAGYLGSSYGRRPVVHVTSMGRMTMITGDMPETTVPDELKMYVARERCRRCPHNPYIADGLGASPEMRGDIPPPF
ncbi:MAG: RQC domain-containing protein [Firmicutes bacterium]|nr:RQC domain-containing protein [Bacillota bacterium]MDD4336862.1 RQC domain-containing protein [Bacillota bacterium]